MTKKKTPKKPLDPPLGWKLVRSVKHVLWRVHDWYEMRTPLANKELGEIEVCIRQRDKKEKGDASE